MTRLFSRRAIVTVEGLSVHTSGAAGLRLRFKVKQSVEAEHNDCDATISNLGETSRGHLLSIADQMNSAGLKPQFIVQAGYDEAFGTLFQGEAVKLETKRTSPGWETTINAGDGPAEKRRVINKALGKNSSVADAIQAIAETMGVEAKQAIADARAGVFDRAGALARQKLWPNGLAMTGTAAEELNRLAKTLGFEWTMVDRKLQVLMPGTPTTEAAILMSPATGLVGSVSRAIDAKRPKAKIWHFRCLLQFNLRPGRHVVVDAADLKGDFVARTLEHSGDTHGAEWYSDVEVEALK